MKTPIAAALAGVMAVSGLAVATTAADAKPKWHPPYHHHHNGGNVAAGAVFGFVAGALASQAFAPNYYYYNPYPPAYYPPPPPPRYGFAPRYGYASYNNAHVQWCLSRYKTYNPATNTYFRKVGVPAVCVSPF